MKVKNRNIIFGTLGAACLLLTAACSENTDFTPGDSRVEEGNQISVSLTRESQTLRARGAESQWNFGDGSHADVIIFALYKKEDGEWKICDTYDTVVADQPNKSVPKGQIWISGGTPITGAETGLKVKPAANQFGATFNGTLNLGVRFRVEDSKEYKIVCWAQNSQCEAYDLSDLQAVKVNYTYQNGGQTVNSLNNDELRDAFCESGDISHKNKNVGVILRRPFAQINIGCAGWDYEGNAVLEPNSVTYKNSQVTITGVADTYNVISGVASVSGDTPLTVTYGASSLPAFALVDDTATSDSRQDYEPFEDEKYLTLDLNGDGVIAPYIGWEDYRGWSVDNLGTEGYPYTETFKYLSMCYVLVPGSNYKIDENGKAVEDETKKETGSVVDIVFSAMGADKDINSKLTFVSGEISNVPVQKNWRTNIVGFDFFLYRQGFNLYVVPEYCGDHDLVWEWGNDQSSGDNWTLWENENFNDIFGDDYSLSDSN